MSGRAPVGQLKCNDVQAFEHTAAPQCRGGTGSRVAPRPSSLSTPELPHGVPRLALLERLAKVDLRQHERQHNMATMPPGLANVGGPVKSACRGATGHARRWRRESSAHIAGKGVFKGVANSTALAGCCGDLQRAGSLQEGEMAHASMCSRSQPLQHSYRNQQLMSIAPACDSDRLPNRIGTPSGALPPLSSFVSPISLSSPLLPLPERHPLRHQFPHCYHCAVVLYSRTAHFLASFSHRNRGQGERTVHYSLSAWLPRSPSFLAAPPPLAPDLTPLVFQSSPTCTAKPQACRA